MRESATYSRQRLTLTSSYPWHMGNVLIFRSSTWDRTVSTLSCLYGFSAKACRCLSELSHYRSIRWYFTFFARFSCMPDISLDTLHLFCWVSCEVYEVLWAVACRMRMLRFCQPLACFSCRCEGIFESENLKNSTLLIVNYNNCYRGLSLESLSNSFKEFCPADWTACNYHHRSMPLIQMPYSCYIMLNCLAYITAQPTWRLLC